MARVPHDIVVVGAGIIGCAVAYEVARRGASVQLLDERPAGMGATQASAGMLAPYIEAREGSPLLEFSVRSLNLFDEFVARVSADSGIGVPYRRTGTLLPKDYWPKDCIIGNCTGGSVGYYLRHFPQYFGDIPVRDIGLIAS